MKPIIEVKPLPDGDGFGVYECGFLYQRFSTEWEAWEAGEALLSDLRYEASQRD